MTEEELQAVTETDWVKFLRKRDAIWDHRRGQKSSRRRDRRTVRALRRNTRRYQRKVDKMWDRYWEENP